MGALTERVRQSVKSRRRARALSSERRAGAHSRREIQRLRSQWLRQRWRAIAIVMALAGLAALASHLFLPDSVAPYAVGAALASGVWVNYVFMLETGGVMSHVVGVLGEEWTADALGKLRKRGWFLVNHVMLEHVDVDHALLGPGGFLSIETKFRSDWTAVSSADHASWAARAHTSALGLQRRMRTGRAVRPMVAMWGPGVGETYPSAFEVDGVTFCVGQALVEIVSELAATVSHEEVRTTYDYLDDYVRTRDRGEDAAQGQQPRRLGQYYNDFMLAALSATAATWLIAVTARFPPAGVWFAVSSVLVIVGAVVIRRRLPPSPRTRAVTTALVSTGFALLAAIGAVVIAYLIRR